MIQPTKQQIISHLIFEWVKQNFGQSEADDPSWNINYLAEYLAKELFNE